MKNLEKIQLENIIFPFYLRSKTTDISTFKQIFERKEYEFNLPFYPKIIIDAGANIGLATIFFKNKYPKSKVIIIEPESNNFNILKMNLKKYTDICYYRRALINLPNKMLNILDKNFGYWGFITELPKAPDSIFTIDSVKSITIEEIMKDNNLSNIDILKIDIEGSEKELFENNYENWLPKTKCIIIEVHERFKLGATKNVVNAILKYNFKYFKKKGENFVFFNDCI